MTAVIRSLSPFQSETRRKIVILTLLIFAALC